MDKKTNILTIPQPDMLFMQIRLVGLDPGLLLNPFGRKAEQQLLDSMNKRSPKLKKDKDPDAEYAERLEEVTWDAERGLYTMTLMAFKNAMVRGAKSIKGVAMTEMRAAFFVDMDGMHNGQPVAHVAGTPSKDTRHVRNKSGTDLRTRVLLKDWEYTLCLTLNTNIISPEQLLTACVNAGVGTGIGDYRPQNNGVFGRWRVTEAHTVPLDAVLEAAE